MLRYRCDGKCVAAIVSLNSSNSENRKQLNTIKNSAPCNDEPTYITDLAMLESDKLDSFESSG